MATAIVGEYRAINFDPVANTFSLGFNIEVYSDTNRLAANPESGTVTFARGTLWAVAMAAIIDHVIARGAEFGITLTRPDVTVALRPFDRLLA